MVLNTNHIYIQPIGSKERLKTGSSSEIISYKKNGKKMTLSFFPFFVIRHNTTTRWRVPAISLCVRGDLCLTICFF